MKSLPGGYAFTRKLLDSIKRQVRELQGPDDEELEAYYRPYSDELERCRIRRASSEAFLARCAVEPVTLVGDFHTLDQSQRAFLRIIRALIARKVRPVLLLEMVSARHDPALDRYLKGEIGDYDFLEAIRYFSHWGFNFFNYKPLFDYARLHRLSVHGLNKPGSLSSRDHFMALRTRHVVQNHPGQPVLVLVGDLHLASPHLPKTLREVEIEPLVLFQNSESVYMRRLKRGLSPTGWWTLDSNRYLANTTSPVVKMQSYLSWLEHGGEALCSLFGFCPIGLDQEEDIDITDTVLRFIRALKDLFGLRYKEDEDFEVYTLQSMAFLEKPCYRKPPGSWFAELVRDGNSMYDNSRRTIYIPILEVNRTVEEATHYLMRVEMPTGCESDAFLGRVHFFAAGYLGSKLINPSRRASSLREMRAVLSGPISRERDRAKLARQREVFRAVLSLFDQPEKGGRTSDKAFLDSLCKADRRTRFQVSRRAGYLLGEDVYRLYDAGKLSGDDLRTYVFQQKDPFFLVRKSDREEAS